MQLAWLLIPMVAFYTNGPVSHRTQNDLVYDVGGPPVRVQVKSAWLDPKKGNDVVEPPAAPLSNGEAIEQAGDKMNPCTEERLPSYGGLDALAWEGWTGRVWQEPSKDGDFYKTIVEEGAGPALDVGCGPGRLLLRFLKHDLEVEGCDASADMMIRGEVLPLETSITRLEQMIERDPTDVKALESLAIGYLYQCRYPEATATCQREIAIRPAHSPYRLLGMMACWDGRPMDAISHLERAILLDPNDYEARGALACAYRAAGRAEDAAEQYRTGAAMASQDDQYGQACYAAVTDDVGAALRLLDAALTAKQQSAGWAQIDPEFHRLTRDPLFEAMIARHRAAAV